MLITPDSAGEEPGALAGLHPSADPAGDKGLTPKGPTGLLQALVDASTPHLAQRALPAMDTSLVAQCASLFEYDAALALDLDGELLGGATITDDVSSGERLGD